MCHDALRSSAAPHAYCVGRSHLVGRLDDPSYGFSTLLGPEATAGRPESRDWPWRRRWPSILLKGILSCAFIRNDLSSSSSISVLSGGCWHYPMAVVSDGKNRKPVLTGCG